MIVPQMPLTGAPTAYPFVPQKNPSSGRKSSPWSRDPVFLKLKELVSKNTLSASIIANQLSNEFKISISRSAVIGKCYREKLPLSDAPIPLSDQRAPRQRIKATPAARVSKKKAAANNAASGILFGPIVPVATGAPAPAQPEPQQKLKEYAKASSELIAYHQSIIDAIDAHAAIEEPSSLFPDYPEPNEFLRGLKFITPTFPKSLVEAGSGTCRYITAQSGATRESYCCGNKVDTARSSKSFCKAHYKLCYTNSSDR